MVGFIFGLLAGLLGSRTVLGNTAYTFFAAKIKVLPPSND